MVLEVIYVVRHGFRSSWVVNPNTGEYNSNMPSPTGIKADPALAGYGVLQAEQLGRHLMSIDPPIDLIYSSPYYRCLQTLQPFVQARASAQGAESVHVNVERGVGEFYGLARFDHPSPAPIEELNRHFRYLQTDETPIIIPSVRGEGIDQLHDRLAYCLQHLIRRADADPSGPKSLLICTHAAAMIAMGRALTGHMPDDISEEDFKCFTCSFSKFVRRSRVAKPESHSTWDPEKPDAVPDIGWRNGNGVAGGWHCETNADCSFLSGGEERGWRFSGDESFLTDPNAFNDSMNMKNGARILDDSSANARTKEGQDGSKL